SDDDTTDAADESEDKPKVTWREDVLLRVMDAHNIDVEHRDAFVEHAVNFDADDNGYLKKAELEDAAKAWNEQSTGDAAEEVEAVEEAEAAEEVLEEASEAPEGGKACPVCPTTCADDADTCATCGFSFADL
ncbi:MAG: hypothetical protein VYA95_07810, partial [Candidatus Thermoplasmatota archaeon]|nr:hypothetical protein [Candidatus Thermoplasmatota archaeon]